jgi:hypothetical protein
MKKLCGGISQVPEHHRNDWPELLQKMGYCPEVGCIAQNENASPPHDDFQSKGVALEVEGLHLCMECQWDRQKAGYYLHIQTGFREPVTKAVVDVARDIQERLTEHGFEVLIQIPEW